MKQCGQWLELLLILMAIALFSRLTVQWSGQKADRAEPVAAATTYQESDFAGALSPHLSYETGCPRCGSSSVSYVWMNASLSGPDWWYCVNCRYRYDHRPSWVPPLKVRKGASI